MEIKDKTVSNIIVTLDQTISSLLDLLRTLEEILEKQENLDKELTYNEY